MLVCKNLVFKSDCLQAREEFHAHLAATHCQQSQSTDLMDDSELLTDDRDLDVDLTGNNISLHQMITLGYLF